jgi:hypothetical protein
MNKKTATLFRSGVVDITFLAFQLWFNNHPGCANKVLRTFFFMAQPPLLWPTSVQVSFFGKEESGS